MATAVTLFSVTLTACTDGADAGDAKALSAVSAILQQPSKPPYNVDGRTKFGGEDRIWVNWNQLFATQNLLKPRWKQVTWIVSYELDRQAVTNFRRQLDASIPKDWKVKTYVLDRQTVANFWEQYLADNGEDATLTGDWKDPVPLSPYNGILRVYSSDGGLFSKDRMFAVLFVPVNNSPLLGVEIFTNFDLKPSP